MPPLEDTTAEAGEQEKPTAATEDKQTTTEQDPPAGNKTDDGKLAAKTSETGDDKAFFDKTDEEIDDKKTVAPADWPDDWRQKIAGKDDKYLKELERFSSFDAYAKSQRALRQKVSSGEFKRSLPENATEEQLAEWRKENGIPEKAEGYQVTKVPGHEWTEADQPALGVLFQTMHDTNATQGQIDGMLGVYAQLLSATKQQQYDTDKSDNETCEDTLRAEWGGEYRGNMANAKALLNNAEKFDPELAGMLRDARTPDGRRVIYNPALWSWLAETAPDKIGASAHVPGGDGKTVAQNASRKAEIEKIMNEDMSRYWRENLEPEYNEILRQEEAASRRGRAA